MEWPTPAGAHPGQAG
ncbi:MAG: DUF3982 domain-containing protein [Granulosicoccus sp.]